VLLNISVIGLSLPTSHAHLRQQDGETKEVTSDRVMQHYHGQDWSYAPVRRQIATVTEALTSSLYVPPAQIPRHSK